MTNEAIAPDEVAEDVRPNDAPSTAVDAGISLSFTRFEAHGERLSKLYKQAIDGKVFKLGGTQMSRGEYETITIEAADPRRCWPRSGARIDVLNSREAIGLGVIKDGHPPTGNITTKAAFERCQANPRATAKGIPRALSHFDWPANGSLGLLLLDGDEKDNLREILTALYPPFAEVAGLVRPSASASVKDPATGGPAEDRRAPVCAARRAGQG